jgi:hypothetical protein
MGRDHREETWSVTCDCVSERNVCVKRMGLGRLVQRSLSFFMFHFSCSIFKNAMKQCK